MYLIWTTGWGSSANFGIRFLRAFRHWAVPSTPKLRADSIQNVSERYDFRYKHDMYVFTYIHDMYLCLHIQTWHVRLHIHTWHVRLHIHTYMTCTSSNTYIHDMYVFTYIHTWHVPMSSHTYIHGMYAFTYTHVMVWQISRIIVFNICTFQLVTLYSGT
jgi:hypothetical protein